MAPVGMLLWSLLILFCKECREKNKREVCARQEAAYIKERLPLLSVGGCCSSPAGNGFSVTPSVAAVRSTSTLTSAGRGLLKRTTFNNCEHLAMQWSSLFLGTSAADS
eukprot:scaffold100184_cov17-Tisochrysis_lutea.AAC.2